MISSDGKEQPTCAANQMYFVGYTSTIDRRFQREIILSTKTWLGERCKRILVDIISRRRLFNANSGNAVVEQVTLFGEWKVYDLRGRLWENGHHTEWQREERNWLKWTQAICYSLFHRKWNEMGKWMLEQKYFSLLVTEAIERCRNMFTLIWEWISIISG